MTRLDAAMQMLFGALLFALLIVGFGALFVLIGGIP
jgi:hypothetical protein